MTMICGQIVRVQRSQYESARKSIAKRPSLHTIFNINAALINIWTGQLWWFIWLLLPIHRNHFKCIVYISTAESKSKVITLIHTHANILNVDPVGKHTARTCYRQIFRFVYILPYWYRYIYEYVCALYSMSNNWVQRRRLRIESKPCTI